MATVAIAREMGHLQPNPLENKVALMTGSAQGIMNAAMDQPMAGYPDLERVSACLDEALRLFAEGDSEQACLCLAEANSMFDSGQSEGKPEAGVTPISFSHPVQQEGTFLARAATA